MSGDSAFRVETTARVAQWRIDGFNSSTYRKSHPFRIGIWNWYLTVEKNRVVYIRLYPDISSVTRDPAPIASFIIRVVSSAGERKTIVHPGISDKQLKNNTDFVWAVDSLLAGKFLIDVEFLDLKISSPDGSEPSSIWSGSYINKCSITTALKSLHRMLSDGIHTDITIEASEGSIGAHRAVLAARSPVFRSMFSHDLKEKQLSTVNISDMSIEACQAFLNYMYGDVRVDDFITHRLALLRAADKYDVSDLKEACHESLLEDIDSKNVLERLQYATLYQLPMLKSTCMRYLVNFGKIYDIKDDFNAFMMCADRELIAEIFQEVLSAWKGF
ncbi:BTB/POZ domain-containing protein [Acorus calamus]|uniref:BTB/POZ domain-containing protein n=1 Tax=Acorus calamus TaxID=4465 RepID=A0AAV9DG81_ACOCL|nr:BTB/POZ domain-containing protein [Acorus calamus]